ncbi:16S rRNA (uracil(1498)-N(3))-methyltransferase [Candidatus Peregrinibacteria bacterium]|jgi:16S rRNA (uracil1498-N3)-methyltransferase|nr:16S rRNA (uracil(1498)-N(3))-methyltransferase [Candidatus Peregrinibacteria bacterium]MBT7483530.1 16S rRNA (uracil(1498)-N(3))-methyltransferase [Candidatus Peregrinibacteria bacterium]MBT7703090.1 16S rRNA (uracil(1498)-N(3))-methyltransferase [Candidatus Peregrinibacteria bacterium]
MTKTLHRFFIHPTALCEDRVLISNRDQVHQMTRVLRVKEGDKFIGLIGNGKEYEIEVMEISKKEIVGRVELERECQGELPIVMRVFQGLPKQLSKFEEVLKHGTELGATEFYPLITANCEAQEIRKRERMEHILKESAEQSERGRIPVLGPEINFTDVLDGGWPTGLEAEVTLFAYAREDSVLLSEVLADMGSPKSVNIVVGPEGGFTDEEVAAAHKQKWTVFGLGPRILRTETAGPAILSALLLGSFSSLK